MNEVEKLAIFNSAIRIYTTGRMQYVLIHDVPSHHLTLSAKSPEVGTSINT